MSSDDALLINRDKFTGETGLNEKAAMALHCLDHRDTTRLHGKHGKLLKWSVNCKAVTHSLVVKLSWRPVDSTVLKRSLNPKGVSPVLS